MILALFKENVLNIQNNYGITTIMELTKLLGKLPSPDQTVFPGRVQCKQIQLKKNKKIYIKVK